MFSNKVIVITGATSGMGESVARMLHERGATLVLSGRDTLRGDTLVKSLKSDKCANKVMFVAGDVSDSTFAQQLMAAAIDSFGKLDGLVNAAGMIHRGSALETSDEQWKISMSTNVDGSFYMSRAAVTAMLDHPSGKNAAASIVNFGSTCALVGSAGLAAYCASKGAIVQLTRAMALDHAAQNIRINAVCPGAVDTPMLMSGRGRSPMSRDDVHAMNRDSIPQNRIPQPQEVAELVCFLLSDVSKHITGTSIPIDGGYTAQ